MTVKNIEISQETRIALLEQTTSHIYQCLERMEKRFDKIDERFDRIDERFDRIDQRFQAMDEKIDRKFYQLLGIYAAGYISLLAMMGHGFHWF